MKRLFFSIFTLSVVFLMVSCKGNKSEQEGEVQKNKKTKTTSIEKPKPPKNEGMIRLLFVGNSHTEYFISLPDIMETLCKENNKSVEIAKLVEMGIDISEILDANSAVLDEYFSISDPDGNYFDYVILQEKTPVAIMNLNDYKENCKNVVDLVLKNSPEAAIYIYELMPPTNFKNKTEFRTYKDKLSKNATEVAKSLPNSGVLPLGSAVSDAYDGKEGYVAIKDGKDLLRHIDQSHHILNDAGFLNSIIIYETIYGEEPKIPTMLPLSTGTGDYDPITLQEVNTAISNPETLLKIAAKYK